MKVERLSIRGFRNVEECEFAPDAKLNFLVGSNGQGKTSLLEALGYVATLRSFRGAKSAEVVQAGKSNAEVRCEITTADAAWKAELKVAFERNATDESKASKVAFINGKAYHNSTQYLSQRFGDFHLGFHTIIFNPSDHDLVRGEPAIRRSYLDRVLAAQDIRYLKSLQKYQRLLQQRNAILKEGEQGRRNLDFLIGFTEPLSQYAAYITLRRLDYLQRAAEPVFEAARRIAPKQAELRLVYLSSWVPEIEGLSLVNNSLGGRHFAGHAHLPSLELLEQAFWKKLSMLEAAEWRSGHSLVGPHRDDWAFYLGDQPLKGHGSQGEMRSALLALKLTEIEQFRTATGHLPLFLLDDFSSELDRERRSFLLEFLKQTDLQVFVTTTEDSFFAGRRFWVAGGKVTEDRTTNEQLLPDRFPG